MSHLIIFLLPPATALRSMFNEYIKTFLLTLVSRIGNIFQTNDDDNGIIKLMEIHVCHDMHKTNLDKTMPQATTLV